MPDPVAVISSAAATVQLADVALRACRSAVTFVSDVKCARKDVNLLRAMLRDVESIARNLRNFIAEFSVSAGAGLEHTVLPDPITDAVAGLRHDIDNINGLLPGQNSGSLPQRVQFVFRGKNVAKALTLLERRKTALILALQILQSQDGFVIRRNHIEFKDSLSTSAQEITHAQNAMHSEISAKLDVLTETLADLHIMSTAQASNSVRIPESQYDVIGRVVRAELKGVLLPLIESSVQHQHHIEDLQKQACVQIDAIAHAVGSQSSARPKPMKDVHDQPSTPPSAQSAQRHPKKEENVDDPYFPPQTCQAVPHTEPQRVSKRCKEFEWRIGSLIISITTLEKPASPFSPMERFYEISVTFIPSPKLVRTGISSFFTTRADKRGYYQLAPAVAPFQIISEEDTPVASLIYWGDYVGLQRLFSERQISSRTMFANLSLLEYAAAVGEVQIVQLLLDQGCIAPSFDNGGNLLFSLLGGSFIGIQYRSRTEKSIIEIARLLCRQGYDLSTLNDEGRMSAFITVALIGCRRSMSNMSQHLVSLLQSGNYVSPACLSWSSHFSTVWYFYSMCYECSKRVGENLVDVWIGLGLDLNTPDENGCLPLELALLMIGLTPQTNLDAFKPINDTFESGCDEGWLGFAWFKVLAKCLIEKGADVSEPGLDPVLLQYDLHGVYEEILRDAGYVPREVYTEMIRRYKETDRLHGAERTALDTSNLEVPSIQGLRHRQRTSMTEDD